HREFIWIGHRVGTWKFVFRSRDGRLAVDLSSDPTFFRGLTLIWVGRLWHAVHGARRIQPSAHSGAVRPGAIRPTPHSRVLSPGSIRSGPSHAVFGRWTIRLSPSNAVLCSGTIR